MASTNEAAARTDKFAIAAVLREIGQLLRLTGGNRFKARAYDVGADAVEGLAEDVAVLAESGRLIEARGIGEVLAAQIEELHKTGSSRLRDALRAQVPRGALALSSVPGMTMKRMRALEEALGIDSVEALKAACEAGRVRDVRGFGVKTEEALLAGLRQLEVPQEQRTLLVDVVEVAERLRAYARACDVVERAEIAGSVRRWKETIGNIDLVIASRQGKKALDAMAQFPSVAEVDARSASELTLRLAGGMRAHVRVVAPERFANALVRYTGSVAHVSKLEAMAEARGASLDAPPATSEAAIYGRAGLSFVPPELREDKGELEEARHASFGDLVALEDIRGMIHCHTVYSDGRNTIEEMAREADAMGMHYLTITDHSPSAHYAGGVDLDRLRRQWDEIARVQEMVDVRILRGTESDILADGGLDYPDAVLEQLDVVIASIHGRMKMDEDEMTKRIVVAMKQPVFKIWGHALGRLVLKRPPIACHVDAILDAIAESRAAIEVNGDPHRLDMAPEWIREARARRIPFVVSVDAHSTQGMHNLIFGVETARRGGLRRREVLNTLAPTTFARVVKPAA